MRQQSVRLVRLCLAFPRIAPRLRKNSPPVSNVLDVELTFSSIEVEVLWQYDVDAEDRSMFNEFVNSWNLPFIF